MESEEVEVIGGDILEHEGLALGAREADLGEVIEGGGGGIGEDVIVVTDVGEAIPSPVAVAARLFGGATEQLHNLFGVRDRKWAEEDGIEEAVDGGVGAD